MHTCHTPCIDSSHGNTCFIEENDGRLTDFQQPSRTLALGALWVNKASRWRYVGASRCSASFKGSVVRSLRKTASDEASSPPPGSPSMSKGFAGSTRLRSEDSSEGRNSSCSSDPTALFQRQVEPSWPGPLPLVPWSPDPWELARCRGQDLALPTPSLTLVEIHGQLPAWPHQ